MIDIHRSADAARLNEIVNHPGVRPWVGVGDEPLDLSADVANPDNYLLLAEHGGMLFTVVIPGIYEGHTVMLPDGRGAWAAQCMAEMVTWMFLRTPCCELMTRIPGGHKPALAAAHGLGMRYEFKRPANMAYRGRLRDVLVHSLTIQEWTTNYAGCEETGAWVHREMARAAAAAGVEGPDHDGDPNHNRYVGAMFEMTKHGQWGKALAFYHRWAQISRAPLLDVVSDEPPTIRFHGALMALTGNGGLMAWEEAA